VPSRARKAGCTGASAAFVALLSATTARAFEVEYSKVYYADRRYHCDLVVVLAAPLDRVQAVLRDYERYPQLDSRILRARVLERPAPDVVILGTTLRACFGPFCRNVDRVERVAELTHALVAITDPARSDVSFGETHTRLAPTADVDADRGATRVSYSTSIAPGFWLPAFVGRRWMLRTLQGTTLQLFMNVEKEATQGSGRDP